MEDLTKPVNYGEKTKTGKFLPALIIIFAAGIGIISGYFLSQNWENKTFEKAKIVKSEKMAGSTDTKAFPDKAEGTLEKGGFEGEGTHKLIQYPKNPTRNVYLTSSLVNLDDFVGKKVRVWGETFAAKKAGWLMDVGRIEVLE